jgi:hypothetical protein
MAQTNEYFKLKNKEFCVHQVLIVKPKQGKFNK